MIHITIDGKQIEVENSRTIIEAAREHGVKIPHFCWHPTLSVSGNCRICLVEVEKMPKLVGVQAEGARVLVDAWLKGTREIQPAISRTLADSIAVSIPRDRIKALRAVEESKGEFIAVSDDEILEAMRQLARGAGVFAEPAGAAGLAGLNKMLAKGRVDSDETAAVIVTGSGLKDVASAMKASTKPFVVEPELAGVRSAMIGA